MNFYHLLVTMCILMGGFKYFERSTQFLVKFFLLYGRILEVFLYMRTLFLKRLQS